ncbi:FAD-dependent oxidoreductase [Altererythrobacter confluentis]|uniref:FAD-dependent oxidoreductase n=1 Tax=Allopontixanthobacter confluentis TaxID=1849021 RepID=A0A6L7GJU3_9SPHN|nr:FAD-dependent oxidoreductase [Allopontixanthobacter confluentis]MXP14911.1 FAD-dependent oxidoreductase [Allopontixanthobacter confluentis]
MTGARVHSAKRGTAQPADGGNTVAIIGGGLAGMSAAMRLCSAGFDVTLYEAHDRLGGNASSIKRVVPGENAPKTDQQNADKTAIEQDVYPHMFCDWYDNFWDLYEHDLGRKRDDYFSPRQGVSMLRKGDAQYSRLLNNTSMEALVENMQSGLLSPAETFLLGYSMLDLAAHPFDRSSFDQLNKLDVNGFIYSRGYSTENVAEMENYILTLIWSIQSEETAAATYQNFLRHCFKFPDNSPFSWLLKGSLDKQLIAPLREELEKRGCRIETGATVSTVRLCDDRPKIRWKRNPADKRAHVNSYDYLVMAVGPAALTSLVMGGDEHTSEGKRLISCEQSLSQLQRMSAVPIPVVDVYFKHKLDLFPKDHVGLGGSKYGLTVLDISQLWSDHDFDGKTAIIIAASDAASIPSASCNGQGWLMLQELKEFYPGINIGKHWRDPDCDIDWHRTNARSNVDYPLFLNSVGSWGWRPEAAYPNTMPRVFFAGDLCRTDVDMATVEGAVQSGFQAAKALQKRDAALTGKGIRGPEIRVIAHTTYSTASFRAAKLMLMPLAYGALAMTAYDQWKAHLAEGATPLGKAEFSLSEYLLLVPMQFTMDWLKGAYWLVRALSDGGEDDPLKTGILYKALPPVGDGDGEHRGQTGAADGDAAGLHAGDDGHEDHVIDLGAATLMALGECASYASKHLSGDMKKADGTPVSPAVAAAGSVLGAAANIGGTIISALQKQGGSATDPYIRRWRAKR